MPINKIKYGNNTLIDLTDTTATASEVLSGYSFHDKTGALVQGSKTIDLTTVTITPTNTTQVIAPGDEYYLNIENMAPTSTSMGSNPGTFWNISWSTQLNAGEIYHVTLDFYRSGYTRHYVYDDDITFNGFPFNITARSTNSSHNAIIKFNTTQISNSLAGDEDTLDANRLTVSVFKESTVIGFSQVTVNGDADLISSNIKKNVDIFGVVGTYEASGAIESVTQDQDGYVILDNDEGNQIIVDELSVTQNGTYTAPANKAYSPVTVNVSGGLVEAEDNDVIFIDYDGTRLYSYSAQEFASLSALPANPSHTGLTAQGWNWTLADAKTYVATYGMLVIGQLYTTSDGKTRIYVSITNENWKLCTIHIYSSVANNVTINWGDGITETIGSTTSNGTHYNHTYSNIGDYVITLTVNSGRAQLIGTINTAIYGQQATGANYYKRYLITKIEVGSSTDIGSYAFNQCVNLETITIPNTCAVGVSGGNSSSNFNGCGSLKALVLPSTDHISCTSCTLLKYVAIPKGSGNSIANFDGCNYLTKMMMQGTATSFNTSIRLNKVILSETITALDLRAFQQCYCLTKITIPATVTSINSQVFNNDYNLKEIHFKPTTPPTLANINAFNGIPANCIIYVPTASLNDYQTAENWSTYSSYMVGE